MTSHFFSDRPALGEVQGPDRARIAFRLSGLDQFEEVTVQEGVMTRHALVATIDLFQMLVEEMDAMDGQTAVILEFKRG
ncbi:MAG: hypothetical protein AAGA72_18305 [Pseudomonadota bacterium]